MSDMDVFAAMGIAGFGKTTEKKKLDPSRFDKNKRDEEPASLKPTLKKIVGPTQGPSAKPRKNDEDDSDEDDDDDEQGPAPPEQMDQNEDIEPEYDPSDQEDDSPQFPITHEITLKDHTKVVSALALDPSGARIVSGSHDYDCKLWDFGGMDMRCKPFKSWEPAGTYHVHDIKFSNDGTKFLCISGTTQAKIFDRDGEEQAVFVKGDPYIRDMKNTSGHVGELTSCAWHPKDPKIFITSSADSTIRIWDTENKRKQKTVIVVKSKERGARTKVTACNYSPDGNLIGGASLDGALHMWQASSNFVRPNMTIEKAHVPGTHTGSLVFSIDRQTVLTRGGDDTVKLWDLRSFKKPLAVHSNLTTLYPNTNAVFSPDNKYIVTGAGATAKGGQGRLVFLDREGLEEVKSLVVDATPVKVAWHSKINQASLSNGQIVVLYSPVTSLNGAKLLLSKGPPRKVTIEDMSDALAAPTILTPHALPMFRDLDPGRGTKRKREKDRMDPRKSKRPELPVSGPGRGGRVGASATQHVVQNLVRDTTRDVDPREALLKYAELADRDPQWTGAWKVNQPKPVFQAETTEEEGEKDKPSQLPIPLTPQKSSLALLLSRRDRHAPIMNHAQSSPDLAINGDKTPLLAVSHGHNGISAKLNGNASYNHPSPATDSPATPVSYSAAPDVKIDMDYQEQESDVRHEPLPIKAIDSLDKRDNASIVPQVGTPVDPSSIPIHAPSGTPPPPPGDLLEDVKMSESMQINGTVTVHMNGNGNGRDDVVMDDNDAHTPATTPGISADFSMASIDGASSTSVTRSYPDDSDDHDREPPAKRARMQSDADTGYTAHSATPPPASAAMSMASPPPPSAASTITSFPSSESTLSNTQFRFCQSTIRSLKKMKDAGPFLRPVDIVGLNIPHYPSIIKTPMDLSTIDRKLASSNPNKPDPNMNNPRYRSADEFVADVRLIVQNTATFNGPDHVVSAMGKRMEDVFDKMIKQMPPPAEIQKPKPPVVKKLATPVPIPPPVAAPKKVPAAAARRASTSMPTIRRSEAEVIGRPKREIHPPPPKDLPYADAPKKNRKGKKTKDDGTSEQMKYCLKILNELHKKQHYNYASPFYEPVDWVKMEIPAYPKVVKKPMDLSTIRRKLEEGHYSTAQKFYDDFKLMIRNCFSFNPAGTPVNLAGIELQRLFDEKWKHLPPLHEASEAEDEDEDEESDDEQHQPFAGAISAMEMQIRTMNEDLLALKNAKLPKEKKKKEKKKEKAPVASTSKPSAKQPKAPSKKKLKKNITDEDVLTFEQKKDLSESISKLDGTRLEKVIQIIHEGVPEIRDSTEEIELEIDQLPAAVLTKLYNYVLRPLRQPAQPKRNRTGKGTGTGGLKRKSMDEEKEAEKIRQLEERMALFEPRDNASAPAVRRDDDSEHSSDSSSGSDSSGSDSE
ncbi:hypothetical protein B0H34DRAFT_670517 [Crassisporium funariophilum]|nr:hypothetical protein B0H34DRAFT_670517 [Crassisporium funariophilum]